MNLYLDTEFDGHGGELISLALAAPDGKHWYGVWPTVLAVHTPWVREHVLPYVSAYTAGAVNIRPGEMMPLDAAFLRASLREYLRTRSGATIYADWPDDFAHLMRVMSGDSYEESWIVDIGMRLLAESDPRPEVPHNALSDAIALMNWHMARTGRRT